MRFTFYCYEGDIADNIKIVFLHKYGFQLSSGGHIDTPDIRLFLDRNPLAYDTQLTQLPENSTVEVDLKDDSCSPMVQLLTNINDVMNLPGKQKAATTEEAAGWKDMVA